jgi:hypothetical protein
MNKNLNNLKNLLHINIKNKKSSFFLNKKILNKQVQSKLIQMKNNNLLNLKKDYNDIQIQINLKFLYTLLKVLLKIHKILISSYY